VISRSLFTYRRPATAKRVRQTTSRPLVVVRHRGGGLERYARLRVRLLCSNARQVAY
jgi:hypothetical protein